MNKRNLSFEYSNGEYGKIKFEGIGKDLIITEKPDSGHHQILLINQDVLETVLPILQFFAENGRMPKKNEINIG